MNKNELIMLSAVNNLSEGWKNAQKTKMKFEELAEKENIEITKRK